MFSVNRIFLICVNIPEIFRPLRQILCLKINSGNKCLTNINRVADRGLISTPMTQDYLNHPALLLHCTAFVPPIITNETSCTQHAVLQMSDMPRI